MDFNRLSHKTLLGKIARLPLRLLPGGMRMPVLQGALRGKRWIVGSCTHGCWLGSYEYDKRILFEKIIREGSVVFDLGAHVGFYTLLASVLAGPGGKVFAFEPGPRNLEFLKEHLRLNRADNVTVIEAAVSERAGETSFDQGDGFYSGVMRPEGDLRVETVALDELVSEGRLPLPDYMKVDVEGAEMLALSGASATIQKARPTIFLATHSPELHGKCREFLDSLGYSIQSFGDDSHERYKELLASPAR